MNSHFAIQELCNTSDFSSEGLKSMNEDISESFILTPTTLGSSATKPKLHSTSKANTKKKKERGLVYRKAPQAPKRFKPAYICFSMEMHKKNKEELGSDVTVSAKRISHLWHSLPPREREYWNAKAKKDKKRYEEEKAAYDGPWKILIKPSKPDPDAPKRPMSSFLFFAQKYRPIVKKDNPKLRNIEVSKLLGVMWKNLLPEDEKQKYIQHEVSQRAIYNSAMLDWQKKQTGPEYFQEIAQDDPELVMSNCPRPYSSHYNNVVENNEHMEQQRMTMQINHEHPLVSCNVVPSPTPHVMYYQPPPHHSYDTNGGYPPQSYPFHSFREQNPSYNIQQDCYDHSAPSIHNNTVHNQGNSNQDYSFRDHGALHQNCCMYDGVPQNDYAVQNSIDPQQYTSLYNSKVSHDSNNSYNKTHNLQQHERRDSFFADNTNLCQEYGTDYVSQM